MCVDHTKFFSWRISCSLHKTLEEGAAFFILVMTRKQVQRGWVIGQRPHSPPIPSMETHQPHTSRCVFASLFLKPSKCTSPLSHLSVKDGDSCYISLPPVAISRLLTRLAPTTGSHSSAQCAYWPGSWSEWGGKQLSHLYDAHQVKNPYPTRSPNPEVVSVWQLLGWDSGGTHNGTICSKASFPTGWNFTD